MKTAERMLRQNGGFLFQYRRNAPKGSPFAPHRRPPNCRRSPASAGDGYQAPRVARLAAGPRPRGSRWATSAAGSHRWALVGRIDAGGDGRGTARGYAGAVGIGKRESRIPALIKCKRLGRVACGSCRLGDGGGRLRRTSWRSPVPAEGQPLRCENACFCLAGRCVKLTRP
jgi:hypothetical protein